MQSKTRLSNIVSLIDAIRRCVRFGRLSRIASIYIFIAVRLISLACTFLFVCLFIFERSTTFPCSQFEIDRFRHFPLIFHYKSLIRLVHVQILFSLVRLNRKILNHTLCFCFKGSGPSIYQNPNIHFMCFFYAFLSRKIQIQNHFRYLETNFFLNKFFNVFFLFFFFFPLIRLIVLKLVFDLI